MRKPSKMFKSSEPGLSLFALNETTPGLIVMIKRRQARFAAHHMTHYQNNSTRYPFVDRDHTNVPLALVAGKSRARTGFSGHALQRITGLAPPRSSSTAAAPGPSFPRASAPRRVCLLARSWGYLALILRAFSSLAEVVLRERLRGTTSAP